MIIFNDYFLDSCDFVLAEGSITERLRRSSLTDLNPRLTSTVLLTDDDKRKVMADLYRDSINVARDFDAHILIGTPTLQANRERLTEANINHNINALAGRFLKYIRAEYGLWSNNICIAGVLGRKHDHFRPEQMLTGRQAIDFHEWQINQLDSEGVDVFLAYKQPALPEATGIANLLAFTTTPYIISLEINEEGIMPDGTTLSEAVIELDTQGVKEPVGYMVNCTSPALFNLNDQPEMVQNRLIGIMVDGDAFPDQNTADNAPLTDCSRQMKMFNDRYKVPLVGGGSLEPQHLRAMAEIMDKKPE